MIDSKANGSRGAVGMSPVRLIAAHELVLEQIRTAIILNRYRPGDTLPPERDLARFLGVSRTTVRGAVAILAHEGLLEVRRGRGGGLFVKAAPSLQAANRDTIRRSRDQLQQVFDYRIAVESACARLAAERRTKADVAQMRQLMRDMNNLKGPDHVLPLDPAGTAHFLSLDADLHLAIAKSARSPWLEEGVFRGRVEMFRPIGALFNHLEPNADYLHDQIVDAIDACDSEKAAALMAAHIESTRAVVDSWLKPSPRRKRATSRSVASALRAEV